VHVSVRPSTFFRIAKSPVLHVVRHAMIAKILRRIQRAASVQRANLQPSLAKGLDRHPSASPSSDHDDVINLLWHSRWLLAQPIFRSINISAGADARARDHSREDNSAIPNKTSTPDNPALPNQRARYRNPSRYI